MADELIDYDEDIILPNTPLSEFFHNFEQLDSQPDKSETISNTMELPNLACNNNIISYLNEISRYLRHVFNYISNSFVSCVIPFEYSSLKTVFDSYSASKVLIPEDLSVLYSYETDDEIKKEICISHASIYRKCLLLISLSVICIILKSSSFWLNLSMLYNDEYMVLFEIFMWIILPTFYIIISLVTISIFGSLLELFYCKTLCKFMKKKLRHTEKVILVLKKCLRLIQEAELIARGFTSASVLGVVERLEHSTTLPITSPERQYPELRKHIYLWTKDMFMLYRDATLQIIENMKVDSDLNFSAQAFAALDLKEFGNLINYDVNLDADLKELLKFTDGLSVSCLKTMYHLVELQVSEFYKFLYLKSSLLISHTLHNVFRKISFLHLLNLYIKHLECKESYLRQHIYEAYRYYRSFEIFSEIGNKTLTLKTNASFLETNIHNMSIHIKAALKRLIDIEDLFEAERKSSDLKNEKHLKNIRNIITEVASEINAYYEYYVKCCDALDAHVHGENQHDISFPPEELTKPLNIQETDVIIKCDIDLPIEDEIFEAVVRKPSLENVEQCDSFVKEQKQNAEVTNKLMHELRKVLIVKADEHRIREERAIAKKIDKERMLPDTILLENQNNDKTDISVPANLDLESDEGACEILSHSEMTETILRNKRIEEELQNINHNTDEFQNCCETKSSSFAASIAALAIQRQKKLGILTDDHFSSGNDSDDEIIG